jgi:hypothetical protein
LRFLNRKIFVVQKGAPFVRFFFNRQKAYFHYYILVGALEEAPLPQANFSTNETSVLTKRASLDVIGLARRKGTSPRGEYSGLWNWDLFPP